jgi:putative addiction module component (TIGR02574 family)
MSVKELEAEIMRLAPKDQAYLFDKLVPALDVEEEPLTTEELDRRAEDLRTGRVQGVSAEEMMSAARRLL